MLTVAGFVHSGTWSKKWATLPMSHPIPHLHRDRLGTFYFRITVAGRTVKKSLRTKDRQLATMRVARINWELATMPQSNEPSVASILQAAKEGRARKFDMVLPSGVELKGINTEADNRRAMKLLKELPPEAFAPRAAAASPEAAHHRGPAFKTVARDYVAELRQAGLEENKGIEDKEATYAAFAEEFSNPRMLAVAKDHIVAFKNIALKTGKASRVNKKIGHLSVLFQWAIGNGHALTNPTEGTRIGKKSQHARKVESYEPFTASDVKKIFGAKTYPPYAAKPHFHWIPFLLLYTGARPEEIASLKLDEVRSEKVGRETIHYFFITFGKTNASRRKVPFHKTVLASGFMAYLAQRRKDDPAGQLFPQLSPTKNGYGKNVSRRFNENYLPTLGITRPTQKLYSFRSTFITRMSEKNVHPAMLMALVGHYEQDAVDLSSPHFKNYQGAKKLVALRDTMDKFDIRTPIAF